MKKIVMTILFAFLSFAVTPDLLADKPAVLLILPFDNATGKAKYDSLHEGIPDLLTAFLSPYYAKVAVIDRQLLKQVFNEKSLNFKGFVSAETNRQLGEMSQAGYIIRGSIQGGDNNLDLAVNIYQTDSTVLMKSLSVTGGSNEISSIAQKAALKIAQYFEAGVNEIKNLPIDENPEQNLNLIYAMGYYHNGQYADAIIYFMKIIKEDPLDEVTRFWFLKSFFDAGMVSHARIEFEEFLRLFPDSQKIDELNYIFNNKKEEGNKDEKNDN